jgi:hypothetical protein
MYSGMRRKFENLTFDIVLKGEIFYKGAAERGDSGSPIFMI